MSYTPDPPEGNAFRGHSGDPGAPSAAVTTDEFFHERRMDLMTSEALAYARLPDGSHAMFMGQLADVRRNVTVILGSRSAQNGEELPVVITRVTDEHMRQLLGLVIKARLHKPANGLHAGDAIILGELCRDYFDEPPLEKDL